MNRRMNLRDGAWPSRRVLIRGADLLGQGRGDLLLEDGMIVGRHDDHHHKRLEERGATVVDADGLVALPGLVDFHAHLREPGQEHAETVRSGTAAAARGGYTAVYAMPNTTPTADTASIVEYLASLGREAGWVDLRPIGAVTVDRAGQRLAELGSMAASRARVRVFSDDGACVADAGLLRRALEYVKPFHGVIAQHAQDPQLTLGAQMHEGTVSAELGLAGWPAVAEETIVARDVLLAEYTQSRLHVCHVSTAGTVEVLRWAKRRGIRVTAEVTPHHLMLTHEAARGYDPVYKVNPPLRTSDDVQALRAGLADGTIDIVATDHAPHTFEAKDQEWANAAMGMVGLETALAVVQTVMVEPGLMNWADVAGAMSQKPARIGSLSGQGGMLAVGEAAHMVLVDPSASNTIDAADSVSRGNNNPWHGRELMGQVRATLWAGHPTVLDGTLATPRTTGPRAGPRAEEGVLRFPRDHDAEETA